MKKNTLKIFATLAICLAMAFAMCVEVSADIQNNCTDNGTGKFKFKVEPKIDITVTDIDLGGICPGCKYTWFCGNITDQPYIKFVITGSVHCPYNYEVTNLWVNDPCVILQYQLWYFKTSTGTWQPYPPPGAPPYYLNNDDGTGLGTITIGAFLCHWEAKCCATPGPYDFPIKFDVEYVCL